MTLAVRRQINSMANGTCLAPGSTKPAAGATALVVQHGTATQVPVFQAETGATTIGQPLVADANGQVAGWLPAGVDVDVDIVWTYLGTTAPAAQLEPVLTGSTVTDASATPKTIDSTGVGAGQALVYDTGTGKFLPGAPPTDLTPVSKSVDYVANAGELVLMTAAHAMTLPHTPPSGSRNGVVALTANCTLVAQAPDTISFGGDSGLSSIVVPAGATVKVIFSGGAWYVADNPVGETDVLQNGVLAAGDLALSAISINTATGALTFTAAAANAAGSGGWVKRASGLLARIGPAAQTVTPAITLPATTKYAVIGVEIDATGAITLVKGADTATQLNTGILIAANSPAITAGKMRIWDFAVWNNAGVFNFSDHTTVAAAGVNMIDRRPWARGANAIASNPNATNYATSTAAPGGIISTDLQLRVECTGAPLILTLLISGVRNNGVNNTFFSPWADGAGVSTGFWSGGTAIVTHFLANNNQYLNVSWPVVPGGGGLSSPASHLFVPNWWVSAGTSTIDNAAASGVGILFTVREDPRQVAKNGVA